MRPYINEEMKSRLEQYIKAKYPRYENISMWEHWTFEEILVELLHDAGN